MMKSIKKKKGFTLIELIIVIAIIAVLTAIAVPKYVGIQKDAKIKADIATAKTISSSVSVLLSQDKIPETIAKVPITIAATTDTAATTADGAAALIGRYLQSVPISSVTKDVNFSVAVTDGIATVYVAEAQAYPNGTAPYVQ